MTFEKIYIFFLFLVFLNTSSCQQKTKDHFLIGVSQCSDDLWRETMNQEMIREVGFFNNVDIIIKTTKDNTKEQIQQIDSLINNQVDILIISPNESKAFTSVIKKANDKGIPVILVDRKIDTDNYTAYIGADNFQIGREVGLYAASILNGKGNVVEMKGWEGSTSDQERHEGFLYGLKEYPDIHIIAEARGNYLKREAKNKMQDILESENKIDLIFAFNDPMATGVYEAYKGFAGKRPFIIGIDALTATGGGVENIQNGIQDASFIYPTGGDKAIDLAMIILTGNSFDRENTLHTTVVDKSNVRVLKLQTEQINEQQRKVDAINSNLNLSLERYSNQKTLFYLSIIITFLISFFLIFLIKAYKSKSKSNRLLEEQNNEIKRQAEELREQKEQLISISNQLEEATHSKLVFFTNISHEFKTPLSLILGPIDSLLAETNLNPVQKELLTLVQKNSKRLLFLISEIIEFRSYENGKMMMNFSKTNFKEFIEEINPLFNNLLKKKNIHFTFKTSSDFFDVILDKEKVEKIYFNLFSNAVKHVDMAGTICVELNKVILGGTDCIKLSVFNTGSYIQPDKLNNVFDRFFKIDQHSEGTGIGLALVSTLVDAHNGKIEIFSKEDYGTAFNVYLPCVQAHYEESNSFDLDYIKSRLLLEVENHKPSLLPPVRQEKSNPLVLIVEDNTDMRSFIRHILHSQYDVIESDNGLDGIMKANKYIPDIVISDVMMDGKNGFELCVSLKNNIITSHIPIILLTACSLDEQKSIGFESGADAYIPKPFNADILKIRIRKLIENRKKIQNTFTQSLLIDNKNETVGEMEEEFINQFRNYVEKHISEPELVVDNIAEYFGLSRSQLYRKTKSLINYSPNDLIRIIRLDRAKRLLLKKVKSVSEVAYDVGFSSPSYFTKCFKSIYGISPTEYVEKLDS